MASPHWRTCCFFPVVFSFLFPPLFVYKNLHQPCFYVEIPHFGFSFWCVFCTDKASRQVSVRLVIPRKEPPAVPCFFLFSFFDITPGGPGVCCFEFAPLGPQREFNKTTGARGRDFKNGAPRRDFERANTRAQRRGLQKQNGIQA